MERLPINREDATTRRETCVSGSMEWCCNRAAIRVHRQLGPGLLESVYEACLGYELTKAGILFVRQKPIPVRYDNVLLDIGFRADVVVADELILELKAVDQLTAVHEAQLQTYLKLSGCRIGLLLNFNTRLLKDRGIRRIVRGVPE